MLTITQAAGVAITSLTAAQGVQDTGGLRIQLLQETDQFDRRSVDMAVAASADTADQVVTEQSTGARVFLDQLAAEALDDKLLDADRTVEGDTQFTVRAPATETDLDS